jgi:hypothetical protein
MSHCKECNKRTKKYEWEKEGLDLDLKERRRLRQKYWYENNKERVSKQQKDKRLQDPVFRENQNKRSAARKLKQAKNEEHRDAIIRWNWVHKLDPTTRFIWDRFRIWKKSGPKRSITWSLTFEQIWDLFLNSKGVCHYTGQKLDLKTNSRNTISLDRIDSSKGYEMGNVVFCTALINRMKLDLTMDDFAREMQTALNYRIHWPDYIIKEQK